MNFNQIFLILSLNTVFCCSAANGLVEMELENKVTIVSTNHVSVYEVWNALPVEKAVIGDVVVALYKFDAEALPVAGDKKSLGVVLVGESGTGVDPVGFKINSCETTSVKLKKVYDNLPSFEIIVGENIKYKLIVTADKKVFVDSQYIGSIQ